MNGFSFFRCDEKRFFKFGRGCFQPRLPDAGAVWKFIALSLVGGWSVVLCSSLALAAEMRTWTDSSETFTIEASLIGVDGEKVKLKKADGKTLTLTLDKLSDADRSFLQDNASATPANPFEAAEREASSKKSSGGKTVDLKGAKTIGDYGETSWSCPPDPSPLNDLPAKKFSFKVGNIPLHSHSKDCGFFFSRGGQKVLYAIQVPRPPIGEGSDDVTKIFLGDVDSGKTTLIKNSLCLTPYGLSPDGTRAMFVQEPWGFGLHNGQKGKIHIAKCASNKLEPFTILNPIENQGRSRGFNDQTKADVDGAAWVSNDLILVRYSASLDRILVLVNINTGKALWKLNPDFIDKSIVLSPGGKYFLVKAGKAQMLIETATGKTVGTLDGVPETGQAKYSFSPDGRKIASCGDEMIRIWNATTGKPEEAFFVDHANSSSMFTWVSNQHLLIGSKLFDITLQAPIWEYVAHADKAYFFGGQFWYVVRTRKSTSGGNDEATLVGVTIPQKKVLERFSSKQNDSGLFVIRPGMKVALKVDPSLSKDRDEIQRSVEEKLRNNDLTLANDAPLTFLLKVTQEGDQPVTYTAGPGMIGREGTKVKFKQEKYQILLQQGNQTLWSRINVTGPPNVSLDEISNASLQSVVNRKTGERHYKDWFLDLRIPAKIPRTDNLGKSTLTEMGLRDN